MFCKSTLCILSLLFSLLYIHNIHAQHGDRFSIKAGLIHSTQDWNFKHYNVPEKESKAGFALSVLWEHAVSQQYRTVLGLGYMQKGYNENVSIPNGRDVAFHDLTLDLGMKITPWRGNSIPYLSFGLRGEHLMDTGTVPVDCNSEGDEVHKDCVSVLSYLNEYNLGGFLNFGLEWDHRYFIEGGYNPTFTNLINEAGIDLWEHCWEIRVGYFVGAKKSTL